MEKHIYCLIEACNILNVDFEFIDKEQNFVRLNIAGSWEYFQLSKTPFNNEVMYGICKDKMHTYELLKSTLRLPETISFLDFSVDEKYKKYVEFESSSAIVDEIEKRLGFPVVIKRNKGALGECVFLCMDKEEASIRIMEIFDRNSSNYDYVALAQQFIPTTNEYRLVCTFGTPVLAYERGNANNFNVKYWESGELATLIEDTELIKELHNFVKPVYQQVSLGLVGFDIIRGNDSRLYLIELNSSPRFDHIIEGSGEECVIKMYQKSIELLQQKKEGIGFVGALLSRPLG